jgi:hypothetical protein
MAGFSSFVPVGHDTGSPSPYRKGIDMHQDGHEILARNFGKQ